MYTFISVLIIITCVLLALIVLVQNSKGGGLASGLSSSNQIMGVRRTTDLLEKLTWGLAIALMVFSVSGTIFMSQGGGSQENSVVQQQLEENPMPAAPTAPAPQPAPAQNQQPTATPPATNQNPQGN
ncbi:MAG: preprotein translocase subunit SecG [Bacteroidota bacterium]